MVIIGCVKSNMPINKSKTPPDKYQPQSFISLLLEMEKAIWKIPDTRMNVLNMILSDI